MPPTDLVYFRDEDGAVPLLDWLAGIDRDARIKCIARLARLGALGYELRRPEADMLRDGIYELRIGLRGVNYRMLYFFSGRIAVVVSHGLTKESRVPPAEVERAIVRMRSYLADPSAHTHRE